MTSALALAAALSGCASQFADHWSVANTAAEVAFAGFTAVDGLQSRNAVEVCSESNPIVGACGDHVPPVVYYPLSVVVHAAISMALEPKYRVWWQGASVGIEADQIYENHALGYHIDGTWSAPGRTHP